MTNEIEMMEREMKQAADETYLEERCFRGPRRHDTLNTLFRLADAYTRSGHNAKAMECLDRVLDVLPALARLEA